MKKIAVIGGGIIGLTLANYLDPKQFEITLFDSGEHQATGASAGIISPWLSKRRNKKWYALAKDGAAFFEQLAQELELTKDIYEKCGTLFLREPAVLIKLERLAQARKNHAPEIGEIKLLSAEETSAYLPLLKPAPALYIAGGARLDGKAYLAQLKKRAMSRGVNMISEKVQLIREKTNWRLFSESEELVVDSVVVAAGSAIKELIEPLGYQVKVTPQKGQLLVFKTDFDTQNWPVAFLEGEADLIPFQDGNLLLGATHENEAGWDLTPTRAAFEQLTRGVRNFMNDECLLDYPYEYRVGTRAYTSDFAPFFGPLEGEKLIVASGLGSSGLTTGPFIASLLSEYLNTGRWSGADYQKEIENYVQKE